jgi:hypothetical protein
VKLARGLSPEFDEEKIHKVRTTIKKMRAIGEWADMPVRKFFKKNYSILGNIRDTQLVLSKIKKGDYEVHLAFRDWLEHNLIDYKAEWNKKYRHNKSKNQLRNLEKIFEKAKNRNKKHSLKFEKHKDQTLVPFMHERPINDDQIHSGRKTIKEIGFLNKWQKNDADEQMKKLSESTGNYMDSINAIRLFEEYISSETGESKKHEAESVLAKWKANKEQEKAALLKNIDSFQG